MIYGVSSLKFYFFFFFYYSLGDGMKHFNFLVLQKEWQKRSCIFWKSSWYNFNVFISSYDQEWSGWKLFSKLILFHNVTQTTLNLCKTCICLKAAGWAPVVCSHKNPLNSSHVGVICQSLDSISLCAELIIYSAANHLVGPTLFWY